MTVARRKIALGTPLVLIALFGLIFGSVRLTQAAPTKAGAPATTPARYTPITVGWGNDDWSANVYTPRKINIYVGDTITWRVDGKLEPHTITFGPMPLLQNLARNRILVTPEKVGPPQLSLEPRFALPTRSTTYDGIGFSNSGFLRAGKTWSLTFTRPGTYRYYCLLHFPDMSGVVVVHTRPTPTHVYSVKAGYGPLNSAADAFFPDALTVHVGDAVIWHGGFHTITFGPAPLLKQLAGQYIIPIPQKAGPPTLTLNPKVALPSGSTTYKGGFLNSGLLVLPQAHNTFRVTFTTAGVYHYVCLVHPGMDGTITVLP